MADLRRMWTSRALPSRRTLGFLRNLQDYAGVNRWHGCFATPKLRVHSASRSKHALHNPGARERVLELDDTGKELYPRFTSVENSVSYRLFYERAREAGSQDQEDGTAPILLHGRVNAMRRAGSRLVFIDIVQDGERVQALGNFRKFEGSGITQDAFRKCFQKIRRGDHLRIQGHPSISDSGEPTLTLSVLPQTLSPCLPDLPTKVEDPETRIRLRHLDLLVNRQTASMLRLKSLVTQHIRDFLVRAHYVEVQTPILAETAGGAIARPFETAATEFLDRKISLRIAPELWLKRLVIGGFDKVFEIGPSFRNEGIDLTHNPEFTTCEFYQAFMSLEDLIEMTESMLSGLHAHLKRRYDADQGRAEGDSTSVRPADVNFNGPYRRIDFIPHIEAGLGQALPDLSSADAPNLLLNAMKDAGVDVPSSASLPQMLDRLSSLYIEPQCVEPTFIMHHPECLSPLAKSFRHPGSGQMVAARAELFVRGYELINTYEEENSPIEQRRKFEDQASFKGGPEGHPLDESYLEALEWGLPPTGGWGGGIERLCMLMTDAKRIGDVLSFGTLRNVVALGHGGTPRH